MILDCHIHITETIDPKETFAEKLAAAGVSGGIVLSYHPASFDNGKPKKGDSRKRLGQVMDYTAGLPDLYPFYFIDPMEEDAEEQVDRAAEAGIAGFKVICCHHYPQDDRAMKIWQRIAGTGKPILFHSGILYNNGPSALYNRPGNFEDLFFIRGLRFAMAHISWPWCDELIAVFGKWNYLFGEAKARGLAENLAELYVDLTPGTPPIYRREALEKLLAVGYSEMPRRMIFGTDATSAYDSDMVRRVIAADRAIYDSLGVSGELQENIFHKNLLLFLGDSR